MRGNYFQLESIFCLQAALNVLQVTHATAKATTGETKMATVTVLNERCIKVEMLNTSLEAETYWVNLRGVYINTKNPILDVDVSRKNGGSSQLNNRTHATRIGRVCSAARKELAAYVSGFLNVQPQGGFDLRGRS